MQAAAAETPTVMSDVLFDKPTDALPVLAPVQAAGGAGADGMAPMPVMNPLLISAPPGVAQARPKPE